MLVSDSTLQMPWKIEGPSTQELGIWVLGNSIYSTGFGRYMIIKYLGP